MYMGQESYSLMSVPFPAATIHHVSFVWLAGGHTATNLACILHKTDRCSLLSSRKKLIALSMLG